jgi:hypothetical protein
MIPRAGGSLAQLTRAFYKSLWTILFFCRSELLPKDFLIEMFLYFAAAEVVQSRHLMSEEGASLNLAEYPATHRKRLRQRRKRFTSCKMNFSKLDRLSKWKALNCAWKLRWLHFWGFESLNGLYTDWHPKLV